MPKDVPVKTLPRAQSVKPEKSSEPECKKLAFAVLSPRSMQLFASLAYSTHELDPAVLSSLAQDVSSRLRLLVQLASLAARRQGRRCMEIADVDFALTMTGSDSALTGHRFQQQRFLRVKGCDLYEQEHFSLLLGGVARNPLVLRGTGECFDARVVSEWLHPPNTLKTPTQTQESTQDDQVAKPKKRRLVIMDDDEDEEEMDAEVTYVSRLVACLGSGDAALLATIGRDLATNTRLQGPLDKLLVALTRTLASPGADAGIGLGILRCLDCINANPQVSLIGARSTQPFHSAIELCLHGMTSSRLATESTYSDPGDLDPLDLESNWQVLMLRSTAARLLASILVKYAPLLGRDAVRDLVSDKLLALLDHCLSVSSFSKCYAPLLCLAYLAGAPAATALLVRQLIFSHPGQLVMRLARLLDERSVPNQQQQPSQSVPADLRIHLLGALAQLSVPLLRDSSKTTPLIKLLLDLFGHAGLLWSPGAACSCCINRLPGARPLPTTVWPKPEPYNHSSNVSSLAVPKRHKQIRISIGQQSVSKPAQSKKSTKSTPSETVANIAGLKHWPASLRRGRRVVISTKPPVSDPVCPVSFLFSHQL